MSDPGRAGGGDQRLSRRLLWFAALWGVGVAVVGTVSLVLRSWLIG